MAGCIAGRLCLASAFSLMHPQYDASLHEVGSNIWGNVSISLLCPAAAVGILTVKRQCMLPSSLLQPVTSARPSVQGPGQAGARFQ